MEELKEFEKLYQLTIVPHKFSTYTSMVVRGIL